MSAFYLLGVFALWATLTIGWWKAWRRIRQNASAQQLGVDVLFGVVMVVWLAFSFWYGGGRKYYYDAEIKRLCAIDGGIKVYETVILPVDKFNQWGQPNFYNPMLKEKALGPEYTVKVQATYIRTGSPSLRKYHVQLFTRSSGRLLGESISYDRGGGDLPGPWQPSGFSCTSEAGEMPLFTHVFRKQEIN